mmetsp:Transcript_101075/g.324669  ORF Transcript_101075/g.324669 Transcript_101075/m.324669 type:complete len:290 (+) Transcript_101075:89-958(+)
MFQFLRRRGICARPRASHRSCCHRACQDRAEAGQRRRGGTPFLGLGPRRSTGDLRDQRAIPLGCSGAAGAEQAGQQGPRQRVARADGVHDGHRPTLAVNGLGIRAWGRLPDRDDLCVAIRSPRHFDVGTGAPWAARDDHEPRSEVQPPPRHGVEVSALPIEKLDVCVGGLGYVHCLSQPLHSPSVGLATADDHGLADVGVERREGTPGLGGTEEGLKCLCHRFILQRHCSQAHVRGPETSAGQGLHDPVCRQRPVGSVLFEESVPHVRSAPGLTHKGQRGWSADSLDQA